MSQDTPVGRAVNELLELGYRDVRLADALAVEAEARLLAARAALGAGNLEAARRMFSLVVGYVTAAQEHA